MTELVKPMKLRSLFTVRELLNLEDESPRDIEAVSEREGPVYRDERSGENEDNERVKSEIGHEKINYVKDSGRLKINTLHWLLDKTEIHPLSFFASRHDILIYPIANNLHNSIPGTLIAR